MNNQWPIPEECRILALEIIIGATRLKTLDGIRSSTLANPDIKFQINNEINFIFNDMLDKISDFIRIQCFRNINVIDDRQFFKIVDELKSFDLTKRFTLGNTIGSIFSDILI